jgi:hypothetical protein
MMSFVLGYYSGRGDASVDENKISYLTYGKFQLDGMLYKGAITVKGPYFRVSAGYPVNERLTLNAGFKYEIYTYRLTDLEVINKFNFDLYPARLMALLRVAAFFQPKPDLLQAKEIIRTVDFSATYRLPLR